MTDPSARVVVTGMPWLNCVVVLMRNSLAGDAIVLFFLEEPQMIGKPCG
jgi:hypothetical protein